MLFRLFQVFLAYVFLSGKLADPDPPLLLVENSTKFFFMFKTFPKPEPLMYVTKNMVWTLISVSKSSLALDLPCKLVQKSCDNCET